MDAKPVDMAYFEDLEDCKGYFEDDGVIGCLKAIGWLDSIHPYRTGTVSSDFLEKLRQLLEAPWEPTAFAGGHDCELCARKGETFHAGSNLHLPSSDGFFVAPSMILHYIEVHNYMPPEAFQAAVIACPTMLSNDFFEEVEKLGPHVPLEEREMWRAAKASLHDKGRSS